MSLPASPSHAMRTPSRGDEVHIATLNVRYDTHSSDPVPVPPEGHVPPYKQRFWSDPYDEKPWAERRSRLMDALLSTGPLDIIGFQEVLHGQLLDLSALLGEGYGYVGVGRDDGREAGEYSPIFWDKEHFKLVRWKTIWLSPTPTVPGSVGWDASQTRIATLLTLARVSGESPGGLVHVVNTHYDDAGLKARAESSLIIREHTKRWVEQFEDPEDPAHRPRAPVILLGDFNSPPEEEGYKNITSYDPVPSGRASFTFLDSFAHLQQRSPDDLGARLSIPRARQTAAYGPLTTYTGFTGPGRTSTSRIDFIMLAAEREPRDHLADRAVDGADKADRARGGWGVLQYACIDNWIEEGDVTGWQGRWSDHRAVRVTIQRL